MALEDVERRANVPQIVVVDVVVGRADLREQAARRSERRTMAEEEEEEEEDDLIGPRAARAVPPGGCWSPGCT